MDVIKRIWRDERAQGMTEYIMAVGLIAIALIGVLYAFRGKIRSWFGESATQGDNAFDELESKAGEGLPN